MIKKFHFDLETTGLDPNLHGIHQISWIIDLDDQEAERGSIDINPIGLFQVDHAALDVSGKTTEALESGMQAVEAYIKLVRTIEKYVSKYDKHDKFFACGYNSQSFDIPFLRSFYLFNNNNFFGSHFWAGSIDVLVKSLDALKHKRNLMKDFKLATVAMVFGIDVDESRLHDAIYDVELSRAINRKIDGLD